MSIDFSICIVDATAVKIKQNNYRYIPLLPLNRLKEIQGSFTQKGHFILIATFLTYRAPSQHLEATNFLPLCTCIVENHLAFSKLSPYSLNIKR